MRMKSNVPNYPLMVIIVLLEGGLFGLIVEANKGCNIF